MSAHSEPATPRRQRRARESGDTPHSRLLTQGLILCASLSILPSATASLWTWGKQALVEAINKPTSNTEVLQRAALDGLRQLIAFSLPVLCVASVTILAAHAIQARVLLVNKSPENQGNTASSSRPTQHALSIHSLAAQLIQVVVSLTILGLYWIAWHKHARDTAETLGRTRTAPQLSTSLTVLVAWAVCLVALAFGAIDYLLANWGWLRRLRMTRAEQQRELRENQGDPSWKTERSRIYRQSTASFAADSFEQVVLVVHEGSRLAIVLRYVASDMAAPQVAKICTGIWAREIIERAQQTDAIKVVQNAGLAYALSQIELGAPIVENLYDAVAELLSANAAS